jgi:hypothetical protein
MNNITIKNNLIIISIVAARKIILAGSAEISLPNL